MKENKDQLIARLNMETARITWQELERHFARGELLTVCTSLDLVHVGVAMINDDKSTVDDWLKKGELRQATDEDASGWSNSEPELWAVVIAPWVLVQEKEGLSS